MPSPNNLSAIPGQLKELFGALREGIVFVVLISLLIWPSYIGSVAKKAGISKGFGLEFRQELEKSQEQVTAAQKAVDGFADDLTGFKQQLQVLNQHPSHEIADAVRGLMNKVDTLQARNQKARGSLQTSLQTQRGIIDRIY